MGSTAASHPASITYTSNWPHEPLIGNTPSTATGVWSIASVILLLAGIGAFVWRPMPPRKPMSLWHRRPRTRCYGPVISGHELKLQRLGVDLLYVALLVVVVGSLAGGWLGVGLVRAVTATNATLFATVVFLFGGILGTLLMFFHLRSSTPG
jgi:nitric oxide reductase large subunit